MTAARLSASASIAAILLSAPAAIGADSSDLGRTVHPLKLPLIVTERSGVARDGVVVTGGVPLPQDNGYHPSMFRVVDADGNAVASQVQRMLNWPEPAHDDGIMQWGLLSFRANVKAGVTSTYYLTIDTDKGALSARPRVKLSNDDSGLVVNTGPARFHIPRKGSALISQAWLGDRQIIDGEGLRAVVTTGEWPKRGLAAGDKHLAHHKLLIEELGEVRTVVRLRGVLKPGDTDGRLYRFIARLYFTAGSPSVRIVFTLANNQLDPAIGKNGKRNLFIWPIEDASLIADVKIDKPEVLTVAEGKPVSAGEMTIYQDSSGGEKWRDLGGGNYERWLSRYTKGKTVRGVTFRGYRVTGKEGQRLAAGNAHKGVIDVAGPDVGIAAALRNFRVEYPSALSAGPKRLRIGLFPDEFSEPFSLRPGARETWDIRLTLHGKDRPDMKALHAVHDRRLMFRPAPAWMVRCANAGAISSGLALTKQPAPSRRRWDKSKLDGIGAGWDWYGWISGWNSAGGHWNQSPCFNPWILWGDGTNFDSAESRTLWAADVTSIHYDRPDLTTFWLMLRDWPWRESRVLVNEFPGYYNRDTWGRPDSGHMAMNMWMEYYLLTGDAHVRESLIALGDRARAVLWAYNHDDRKDGGGPLARGPVNWCRKRDPDAEPDFRLATRYTGWPLFDLAQAYRLTGDAQLLAEARNVARSFRNTARYSPIGFMVTQINAKGDRSVYGHQGPFEKGRAESASQCYAHFQQGIMAQGLLEYYRLSRDVEALDALIGFADCMCHHAMMRSDDGQPLGWSYAFGDYWGPYSLADLGGKTRGTGFSSSNFRVIQPLGWIYRHTGRKDYLEVVKAAVAARSKPWAIIPAANAAILHPKADATPPAAVTDLEAEALSGGKVRLTWTSPRGQAATYQVKTSRAKIVERVTGWPDRTPPLPINKKEWEARAAAFNARQRAFWAADNVDDEPAPRPAGAKETMVLAGLAPGRLYIALKSWDDAENISDLSNVVTVNGK